MPSPPRKISFRTRWAIWRARYTPVGLLARLDETRAVGLITAIHGGVAILTLGVFAWLTNLPLTFPALGPTAFILFATPTAPSAAPRSVIVSHLSAMMVGWLAWQVLIALVGEQGSGLQASWETALSTTIALAITCALLVWLNAPHPPACASCLIVALGGCAVLTDVLLMAAAVFWLTAQAYMINRWAGLPVVAWAPKKLPDIPPE